MRREEVEGEKMMDFAIDLDGTIARRNSQELMRVCNRDLKLGISRERLLTLTYQAFLEEPEVLAHKHCVGEARFATQLSWLGLLPSHLRKMLSIRGAVEGVQRLSQI